MPCAFHAERPFPFEDLPPGCQFGVPEEELIEVDGERWCPFHAPMKNKNQKLAEKGLWDESRIEAFNARIFEILQKALEEGTVANLAGVVFPGRVDFSKKKFPEVFFRNAQFSDRAWFRGAHFSGNAWFGEAQFSDHATFSEARFDDLSDFQKTQFSKETMFSKAHFSKLAWFRDAQLGSHTNFSEVHFDGNADFTAKGDGGELDTFQWISFRGARFSGEVSFNNRQFRQTASFNACAFERAPGFHNCELHQDTDFGGARFLDTKSDGAVRAYRTLKLAMENHRARQEEGIFYALEMKSRQASKETSLAEKAASSLYDLISDYGRSFMWPLGWLVLTTLVFFALYFYLEQISYLSCANTAKILGFTVEQIVRPFAVWKTSDVPCLQNISKQVSLLLVQALATLQSIISFSLLALFLLALRWQFKRD